MMNFTSFTAFAAHLEERAIMARHAQAHALDVATRLIQAEARAEIGRYQAAAGPFAGWPGLADATQEDRQRMGFPADEPELRNGTLRDNIDRSSDEHQGAVGVPSVTVGDGTPQNPTRDIGDVARWQEEGTTRSPPRSFLGHAAVVKEHEVVDAIALEIIHAISGVRPNSV